MENYIVDDEAFTAFLNKVADDKEKGNRKSSSNYEASYEEMKWVGLENDSAKIVRIVGAPPESMTLVENHQIQIQLKFTYQEL